MSINVVLNGQTYQIPEPGDNTWGQELTDYFVALGSGVLQKAGGTFTLTAEVNFGATYGLKSAYYKSRATTPSSTGVIRLGNTEIIGWRNFAGDDDMELSVDASNQLTYNGHAIIPSTALTASKAVVTNGSGVLTTATTTATEIGYVAGVSSAIQTQIDGKIGIASHTALSIIGRSANSSGDAADIAAGTDNFVLRRSGTTLGFGTLVNANIDAAAAIDFSKLAALTSAYLLIGSAGNVATAVAMSGDTTVSNAGVVAIGANKVTDAMIRQSVGLSIIGRSASTTGNVADITAGTDAFVLRRSGTAIGFGLLVAANLDPAAAIAFTQLASLTSGNLLVGSAGNVAVSVSMSGDVTISNAGVTAIGANKVTLAMMAQVTTPSFLGRTSASTGNVESLTVTQATALLNNFVGDSGLGGTKGLVPAPAAGDAAALKFLKADGSWSVPAGAGDVAGPSSAHDGGLVLFNGTTGKLIKESTIAQHNVITSGANGTLSSVAPSTAGKVLVSDGTDWTAALPPTASFVAPTIQNLGSTGTATGWLFTITSGNATVGATYTNNSNTYTVLGTISAGLRLLVSGTGATSGSTLTKATGSGDATITFASKVASATYTTPTSPRTPLYLRVRVIGGGGGGGGGGAGAGAGGAGGDSTFNYPAVYGYGGVGGGTAGTGGAGGSWNVTAGQATFIEGITGATGNPTTGNVANDGGGGGGVSYYGGAGIGGVSTIQGTGSAITNSGSGGGGAFNAAASGAGGGGSGGYASGIITSPAATYGYVVGVLGTAGAGANGGGSGGSGNVIVEEYYQ